MRIGLETWGSEGDVRPFLALGGALARRGHEVRLVITEIDDRDYGQYADLLGIDICMVASPVLDSAEELTAVGEVLLAMGNAFRQGRYISEQLFEPGVPEMFDAARRLAAWSDVVVRHYFHHPAALAAELECIPQASVSFSPDAIPSADQPPGHLRDFGAWSNRMLWSVAVWALDRTFLPPMNRLRERCGVEKLVDTMAGWYARELNIVAVSGALRPRSDDWDAMHEVTGFLDLPDSQRFDPLPPFVDEFIRAGDTPVFIGFGSLTPKDHEHIRETLDIVEGGVARAGCRAIVQGLAAPGTGTPSILHVGRVPHSSLFPRVAAVVHHAGAGTTQTAARAATPSIGVPHLADQFYWSRRLYELGVAARPLRRSDMTARRLGRRIAEVLESDAIRQRCRSLAAEMANEDGAERAAELIEALGG